MFVIVCLFVCMLASRIVRLLLLTLQVVVSSCVYLPYSLRVNLHQGLSFVTKPSTLICSRSTSFLRSIKGCMVIQRSSAWTYNYMSVRA